MADAVKDKKQKVILLSIIGFLALVFIIVVAYNYFKDKAPSSGLPDVLPPNPGNNGSNPPVANDSYPLQKGSKGANVKYLQQAINRIIKNSGKNLSLVVTEDGSFGDKTYNALVTGVGTSTYWATPKVGTYPVSLTAFTQILQKSNANRVIMGGNIYEFTNN